MILQIARNPLLIGMQQNRVILICILNHKLAMDKLLVDAIQPVVMKEAKIQGIPTHTIIHRTKAFPFEARSAHPPSIHNNSRSRIAMNSHHGFGTALDVRVPIKRTVLIDEADATTHTKFEHLILTFRLSVNHLPRNLIKRVNVQNCVSVLCPLLVNYGENFILVGCEKMEDFLAIL